MSDTHLGATDRRALLKTGLTIAGGFAITAVASPAAATIGGGGTASRAIRPELLRAALRALQSHGASIRQRDRIAIADFAAPSSQPRFHLVDLIGGKTTSLLVAHGSGSDPAHTGWVNRFSNIEGSNASSQGAFVTDDYYVGKHGRSQRLIGLDPTNNNALARAIVVHAAWYANPEMLATHGMIGRSQGCFAVGERQLAQVFDRLGPGRMIYAAKV